MRILLLAVLVNLSAATSAACEKTLVEHYYGKDHDQLDDGACYSATVEVTGDDPTFAQGYFLKEAADAPTNAKCLDGSPALYYWRKGTGTGVNKWYIWQQGGGWCYDLKSCVSRATGRLGSTKDDKPNMSIDGGYFSVDQKQNPLMYNWNAVYIRYCDGASLSGDKLTPTVVDNSTLFFRGRAILDAEIEDLLYQRGMKEATDVIVSGCSAGGLATFLHCDHWAKGIGLATNGSAKVACMPDSGFFLDDDHSPKYGSNMRNVFKFQESSAEGLNAACVAAHKSTGDPEKCIFAQWSSAHILTPTFPLQSEYDTWQQGNVAGEGVDMNDFGKNLTALVKSQLLSQPQHGIFLESCSHHCGSWNGPIVDRMTSSAALEEWYNKGSVALENKGFFNQGKTFPCKACCSGSGDEEAVFVV